MTRHKHTFDWASLRGSPEALKWNARDLAIVDQVLALVAGRTAVVQAGGNLGIFAKYLARSFQTVYVFEPAPDLFVAMTSNAPEPNIVRFQAALGATRELVGVSRVRRDGKPNVHEGITHIDGPGVIPTLRLDDLALPVCDLLYLDTEGWELYALRGAVDTIRRCRPVLVIEINKNCQFVGLGEEEIRAFVLGFGYQRHGKILSDEIFVPNEWRAAA